MKKAAWKRKIKKACKDAGTYEPYFDCVIDTLAGIMESRDDAAEKYDATGRQSVVMHTNKAGATNVVKNPALVVVDDLNKTALAYWRDLGLTPMGLKRLDAGAVKTGQNKHSFADVLGELGI